MSNRAGVIKKLMELGYKEKHIVMITKDRQPYINKIMNGKLHKNTMAVASLPEDMSARKEALDKLLSFPDLYTIDEKQDERYIKVLKIILTDKEQIYEIYNHYAKNKVNRILAKKSVNPLLFDSTLLGIDVEVFLDLIIDFV